jgi:outer membrane biosynthesis protein TonB
MKLLIVIGILVALVLLPAPIFCVAQSENQAPPSNQPQEPPAPVAPQSEQTTPTPPQAPPPAAPEASAGQKQSPQTHKSSKKKRKKTTAKKPSATQPSGTQPGKVVVRNGGVRDDSTQLAPGMSKEQELHQRETISGLLAATDTNLNKIAGHQLAPAQQDVVDQIHSYVRQAKTASDSGDLARAHTLAFKAQLLSDELARK